jgi:PPM family protein phosphatase
MTVACALATDPGRDPDKSVNEDSARHGQTPHGYLAVVCDGMGGHEGGLEASRAAIAAVFESVQSARIGVDCKEMLKIAVELANTRVFALGGTSQSHRPGSTIVATLVHDAGCDVAHVGDSRVYLTHGGTTVQVTRDHSAVQMMVDAGVLTPAQAQAHPDANIITRALGMGDRVRVDVRATSIPYVAGDVFLLCSDGFSDLAGETEISAELGANPASVDLTAAAQAFVDLANERGGHDNITVLLVRCNTTSSSAKSVPRTVVELDQTVQTDRILPIVQAARGQTERPAPAHPMDVEHSPLEPGERTVVLAPRRTLVQTPMQVHGPASQPASQGLPPPPPSSRYAAPAGGYGVLATEPRPMPKSKVGIVLLVLVIIGIAFALGIGATLVGQRYFSPSVASSASPGDSALPHAAPVALPSATSMQGAPIQATPSGGSQAGANPPVDTASVGTANSATFGTGSAPGSPANAPTAAIPSLPEASEVPLPPLATEKPSGGRR